MTGGRRGYPCSALLLPRHLDVRSYACPPRGRHIRGGTPNIGASRGLRIFATGIASGAWTTSPCRSLSSTARTQLPCRLSGRCRGPRGHPWCRHTVSRVDYCPSRCCHRRQKPEVGGCLEIISWMNVIASGMFLSVLEGKHSSQPTRDINRASRGSLEQETPNIGKNLVWHAVICCPCRELIYKRVAWPMPPGPLVFLMGPFRTVLLGLQS